MYALHLLISWFWPVHNFHLKIINNSWNIFNSILGVWKSLGPNTVFRLSNFSNQSDSYFQIHCQNLNQLKINCSKFIKFHTTGERIRLQSYGFQNTPDRPTRSYPLKVRMGGNSDDSSTREPCKVVIIKLLWNRPWYKIPGCSFATWQTVHDGRLWNITFKAHLIHRSTS